MNELQLTDRRVREAMAAIPRKVFLRPDQRPFADEDRPLDIGEGQTTSQPSLIAWTLEQLELKPGFRALEVGTGCGYQTALVSTLCAQVYSIDIESVAGIRESILSFMTSYCQDGQYDLILLLVTDILNQGSEVFFVGELKEVVGKAFDVVTEENSVYLPGVVSRKKQIIPNIANALG